MYDIYSYKIRDCKSFFTYSFLLVFLFSFFGCSPRYISDSKMMVLLRNEPPSKIKKGVRLRVDPNRKPLKFPKSQYDSTGKMVFSGSSYEINIYDSPEVRKFINHYKTTEKRFIQNALTRSISLREVLDDAFRRARLSPQFISVAIVESGLSFKAKSGAGAEGLWQMMPKTARGLGLTVNPQLDERLDVKKSTIAAGKYLNKLFHRYGDWYLALAAYNAGPTAVDKAIRKCKSRDFFVLARRGALKKETSEYVPRVLAVASIYENPLKFGFDFDLSSTKGAYVESPTSSVKGEK